MPVPSGSSIESDLRATREARGLSLDDIQQETRIPVDVLRRFESGDLAGDPTFNPVYLKAFLRSYAAAVGLPAGEVTRAFEAQKAGTYRGELDPGFSADDAPSLEVPPVGSQEPADAPVGSDPAPSVEPPAAAGPPPAVEAIRASPATPPPAAEPPKTLAQVRASRPPVPTARRSFDKNWGTILALTLGLVVALGTALWLLVFRGGDRPEAEEPVAASATDERPPAEIDSSGVGAGAATAGPRLQFPIRMTVTAGGDGLQWFRVSQDGGERSPHWIDAGGSQAFTADSSLVLWGEGNEGGPALEFGEAVIELQGQRWTPANGRPVRVDRETGQRLLDSLAAAGPAPVIAPPSATGDSAAFE